MKLLKKPCKFIKKLSKSDYSETTAVGLISSLLPLFWLRGGFDSVHLTADMARDLHELSNIWIGRIVWLGPELNGGFHITPFFFYLFFPFLWIFKGKIEAFIIFNMILSSASIFWMGRLAIKKKYKNVLLIVLLIALTPLWQEISISPGNGYSYLIFLLAGLTSMWFKQSIVLSAVLLGIAISFHPASIFALPILFYQWFSLKKKRLLKLFYIVIALIIPWTPIIIFQVLTKGYWVNINPSAGGRIRFLFNFKNLFQIIDLLGLKFLGVINFFLWILLGFVISKRLRIWYLFAWLGIIFFIFTCSLPCYYLFGIAILIYFILVIGLSQHRIGSFLLFVFLGLLIYNSFVDYPQKQQRSISFLKNNVKALIQQKEINKDKKIAILSAHGRKNPSIPQSNEYRFFLRVKGYDVLAVPQYSQADVLVMFVEHPQFDWEHWVSWEISEFGAKKLEKQIENGKTRILIFSKK